MPQQKAFTRAGGPTIEPISATVETAFPLIWDDAQHSTSNSISPKAISRGECLRKLWHIAPAATAFVLPFFPHYGDVAELLGAWTVRLLAGTIVGGLAATILASSKTLSRQGERDFPAAVAGYALMVMIPLLIFPHKLELGMTVLAVIAVGDGAAGLIGMRYGGQQLAWNPAKTVTGTMAFVAFGIPAATCAYWLGSHSQVPLAHALLLGTMTTLAAAFAESVVSEINDNIRVGVAAIGSVLLWHGLLSVWN